MNIEHHHSCEEKSGDKPKENLRNQSSWIHLSSCSSEGAEKKRKRKPSSSPPVHSSEFSSFPPSPVAGLSKAHLDQLCSSQSSRLVRPAMRCLCLAAVAAAGSVWKMGEWQRCVKIIFCKMRFQKNVQEMIGENTGFLSRVLRVARHEPSERRVFQSLALSLPPPPWLCRCTTNSEGRRLGVLRPPNSQPRSFALFVTETDMWFLTCRTLCLRGENASLFWVTCSHLCANPAVRTVDPSR